MRKKLIAGNWKMNTDISEGLHLAKEIYKELKGINQVDILLIPPATHLFAISASLKNTEIKVGAQDCSAHKNGAFTGELSAQMLSSTGAEYVLIGHSERRIFHSETGTILAEKMQKALESGLIPIYCFGETLEQRENNHHFETVKRQLSEVLSVFPSNIVTNCILAYEPVWAIGTGRTATVGQAAEMHAFSRKLISEMFDAKTAENIRILYGGSMKPENAESLLKISDIDGGLIGGASLKAEDFCKIVKAIL